MSYAVQSERTLIAVVLNLEADRNALDKKDTGVSWKLTSDKSVIEDKWSNCRQLFGYHS